MYIPVPAKTTTKFKNNVSYFTLKAIDLMSEPT